jgi:DNA-binding response OmpR family regulator
VIALVVDDNPVVGPAITKALRDNGWTAEWAADIKAARIKTTALSPDVLVLDLMLNGDDGVTLLQEGLGADRRVVVLSAAPNERLEQVKRAFPTIVVLQKPLDPKEIIKTVASSGRPGR